jgi:hypothetical protein
VLVWNPDLEPSRYASGLGHNFLELFARLHVDGVPVTLGSEVPSGTRLLVLYAVSIEPLAERKAAHALIRRHRGRYALIRADAPPNFRLPIPPLLDVVPIPSRARRPHERWIPPLPQRGLIPRKRERFGSIRVAAFKGNPENVPAALRSESFAEALSRRGIELRIDTPARTDGADQSWHDFSGVDVVLCLRRLSKWRDITRKPPTRLINAWCAGCIPLAGREAGYVELATDEEDVFFVDDASGCLDILDRLADDSRLLRRVERQVAVRGRAFAGTAVLGLWRDALLDAAAPLGGSQLREWVRTGAAAAAEVRGVFRRT